MKYPFLLFSFGFLILFAACEREEEWVTPALLQIIVGEQELEIEGEMSANLPIDRSITLAFSQALDPSSVAGGIRLLEGEEEIPTNSNLISNNTRVVLNKVGTFSTNTVYTISINENLQTISGVSFSPKSVAFRTQIGDLALTGFTIEEGKELAGGRISEVPLEFRLNLEFSNPIEPSSFQEAFSIKGQEVPNLGIQFDETQTQVTVRSEGELMDLSKYTLSVSETLLGQGGEGFAGFSQVFYTSVDETPKFPVITDEDLLTLVQEQTFRYFWDFAHPNSGLARERNSSGDLVTIGGSGFGVMALIVGVERGFITRKEAVERWVRIVDFLGNADRFHGVWPHWLNGNSGQVIPFSQMDDGGDLVETSFMIQALLTLKAYLDPTIGTEGYIIDKITRLWRDVEWDWYTRGDREVLYWHWSPEHEWGMNLPIQGYNECLITYLLAAGSPTRSISRSVYEQGWARGGDMVNGNNYLGINLPLGSPFGGPLFFAHYSYLGLDPRTLSDQYANYWEQNVNHTLINRAHCIENPQGWVGYSERCWGLTASDNQDGYSAHSPTNDRGVITPSAALSSMPYTPEESMEALRFFYYQLGDRIWGEYGFHDAFNITEEWYADSYLAIDQGPIILMIENYRTGLLWDLFMQDPDLQSGLENLLINP
ncbi:glucoamylase family protein [Pleomorphovibrio marinus]|uniref:glucoamylase family protein n=1 Tax=Pleomorphovibrio marinus TaxID=2164132 RepID=UPI000E0C95C7|nr:glucoamylase family protein [Pleomorphovibrio marinus]